MLCLTRRSQPLAEERNPNNLHDGRGAFAAHPMSVSNSRLSLPVEGCRLEGSNGLLNGGGEQWRSRVCCRGLIAKVPGGRREDVNPEWIDDISLAARYCQLDRLLLRIGWGYYYPGPRGSTVDSLDSDRCLYNIRGWMSLWREAAEIPDSIIGSDGEGLVQ